MPLTLKAQLEIEDRFLDDFFKCHAELEKNGISSPLSGIEELILQEFVDFRKKMIEEIYK
jgi:hypothetical protein